MLKAGKTDSILYIGWPTSYTNIYHFVIYIYMCVYIYTHIHTHEGCPESICPFWISREPVTWPWCNLASRQRRPYCAPLNSHSPIGLVSRQWDAVDLPCVLCDRRIRNDWASRLASQKNAPAHSTALVRASFSGKASHHPGLSSPLEPRFGSPRLFHKQKSPLKGRFVHATVTHYTSSVNGVSLPTD